MCPRPRPHPPTCGQQLLHACHDVLAVRVLLERGELRAHAAEEGLALRVVAHLQHLRDGSGQGLMP